MAIPASVLPLAMSRKLRAATSPSDRFRDLSRLWQPNPRTFHAFLRYGTVLPGRRYLGPAANRLHRHYKKALMSGKFGHNRN